jgi:hypothetical protein
MPQASGTFEVKLTPQNEQGSDAALGRLLIDKQFSGLLEGVSKGQMLTAATEVKESAGYVAIEKFSGKLEGKTGTFILQHAGVMNRGAPGLIINVVPDSGTDHLKGIAGHMSIQIADGKHSYIFDYSIS